MLSFKRSLRVPYACNVCPGLGCSTSCGSIINSLPQAHFLIFKKLTFSSV